MLNETEIGQYPVNFQNFLLRAKKFDSDLSWDNILLFAIRVIKIKDKLCYFDDHPVENLGLYFERILKIMDYLLEVDWGRLYLFTQDIAHNLSSTELGQHEAIIKEIYSKLFSKISSQEDLAECVELAMPSKDASPEAQKNFMHIFENYFIKPESHRQRLNCVEITAVAHKQGCDYFVEQMISKIQYEFTDQIEKQDEKINDKDSLLVLNRFLKERLQKENKLLAERRKDLETEIRKLKRERVIPSADEKASKEQKKESQDDSQTLHYCLRHNKPR